MSSLLRIRRLSKSFGGLRAVRGVDMSLEEEEILGVIGPNGAGKTTLFNLISGSMAPDEGSVELNGEPLVGLRPFEIAERGIARTYQVVKPFGHMSVLANVMVGAFLRTRHRDEAEATAHEVLEITDMADLADQVAAGLTLGGRKRLELARALSTGPRVLLLDEVMAGLTPTEGAEMVDMIERIRSSGIALLVIEHVMSAIMAVSDRIAVIHHGELLAVGAPADIARDRAVVDAYLGEEFQIATD